MSEQNLEHVPFGISGMGQAEAWFVNVVEETKKGKEQHSYLVWVVPTGSMPMRCLCLTRDGSAVQAPSPKFREDFLRRRERGGQGLPGIGTNRQSTNAPTMQTLQTMTLDSISELPDAP